MYKILDFGILEIKKQPIANLDNIYACMNEEFTYSSYPLNKDTMYNYIHDCLWDLCSKWKKKWEKGEDRASECLQAAWKTLLNKFGAQNRWWHKRKWRKHVKQWKTPHMLDELADKGA